MGSVSQSSKLEAYLAVNHPAVKQLLTETHDEVMGYYQKIRVYNIVRLQFDFGVVDVQSESFGVPLYEMVVLAMDNLDSIMKEACGEILKSSEIKVEDHESILAETVPRRIVVYSDKRSCEISIRHDVGFWKRCADELHEYGIVCCAEEGSRMVYKEWYFCT